VGAGTGVGGAFLYSGPAINVLAIILTARVLGPELGIARAVGAVVFAVVIGLTMHLLFRREEAERAAAGAAADVPTETPRKLWQDGICFAAMVAFLVFANGGRPADGETGFWAAVFAAKWWVAGASLVVLASEQAAMVDQRDEVGVVEARDVDRRARRAAVPPERDRVPLDELQEGLQDGVFEARAGSGDSRSQSQVETARAFFTSSSVQVPE
jgi:hypothetical protein